MKLAIGLIHNGEKSRVTRSHQQIYLLMRDLEGKFESTFFETVYQLPLVPITYQTFQEKESLQNDVIHQWCIYRNLREIETIPRKEPTESNRKRSSIELILTDKHLRSLDKFLEQKKSADWLLMLEDDAIFTEETISQILHILKVIFNEKTPTYIDLGGGYPLPALQVDSLIEHLGERTVTFKKAVTNTACCYLLNLSLAEKIRGIILNNPRYRLIPFDWLINKCFIDLSKADLRIMCMHFFPPIMIHGSMSGHYRTTVQLTES